MHLYLFSILNILSVVFVLIFNFASLLNFSSFSYNYHFVSSVYDHEYPINQYHLIILIILMITFNFIIFSIYLNLNYFLAQN